MVENTTHKQRGSISILGALTIVLALSSFTVVLELGQKMIEDRNFNNFAQAIAPVALRTELSLTQAMVNAGEGGKSLIMVKNMLQELGYDENDLEVTLQFGNIESLSSPTTWTDPTDGSVYQVNEAFTPLASDAASPKAGLSAGDPLPEFSAVSLQIKSKSGVFNFYPKGRAIYGVSASQIKSTDVGNCYCDIRYNQCLVKAKTNNVMGDVDTKERSRYCETGIAPSVSGGMMGMFFGGDAEYYKADTVKFSPQWVGTPYKNGNVHTDQSSSAWTKVSTDQPLTINSGVNPFPEAYWDAAHAAWQEGNQAMQFNGAKKVSSFFGTISKTKNPWVLDDDTFYVGRSGVCAYPSNGFFFMGIMSQVSNFMKGNTDCIRYKADPVFNYDYAKPIQSFMLTINGITGANEHYYSCRDFSGIQSSRSGFFQVMWRIWSSPLQDWNRSYQESECAVKKMTWHGWWIFSAWRT